MLSHVRIGLVALSLTAAAFGASADDKAAFTVTNDVVYTKAGDRELKLDMARPADGDGPFPAVIAIHGGAWREGDKAGLRSLLGEFAKRGYVAISPQYRLCPKETFPAQVHDVKAAVRWLRTHASEYKIDPDHIGATGFSAGGHLALMLGLTDPGDGLEGEVPKDAPSSRVQAVVNFFGPTDLAADDLPDVSKPLVGAFLGGLAVDKPDAAKKASPITFTTKDDPPILTFQGTKDPLVPYTQAFRLTEALTKAGGSGRVELMIGAGHGWGGAELKRSLDETVVFFDTYLKKPPSSKP